MLIFLCFSLPPGVDTTVLTKKESSGPEKRLVASKLHDPFHMAIHMQRQRIGALPIEPEDHDFE